MINKIFNSFTRTSYVKSNNPTPRISIQPERKNRIVTIHRYSYVFPTCRTLYIW